MYSYSYGRSWRGLVSNSVTRRDENGVRSYDASELYVYLFDVILLESAKVELYLSLDRTSGNQDVVEKTDGDGCDRWGHCELQPQVIWLADFFTGCSRVSLRFLL